MIYQVSSSIELRICYMVPIARCVIELERIDNMVECWYGWSISWCMEMTNHVSSCIELRIGSYGTNSEMCY